MQINRLIRLAYYPRIAVYLGAALTLLVSEMSNDPVRLAVAAAALLYPHVIFMVSRRYFNHARGAGYSTLTDAVMTGVLIVAMDFNLLASLSFSVCLVIGTLLISPPMMLLFNASILVVICGLRFEGFSDGHWIQDAFSVVLLVGFSGLVAYLCYRQTSNLVAVHRAAGEKNVLLQEYNVRLRPYISPQVLRFLTEEKVIASRRQHLTVFFSDIEGFTHLMDHLNENTITRLLNEYLDEMAQIAHRYGGTVDKFMGDGVMVFFGESGDIRVDAVACVRMALAMRETLFELAKGWHHLGPGLHIRIGIHSGFCTVGNFGSCERMDFTAVGSTVNRASRLESCADTDEILVSDATWRLIREKICCLEKEPVQVKGISGAIRVFSVAGVKAEPRDPEPVRLLN